MFMFAATTTAAPTTTTLPTSEFAFAVLFVTYASNNATEVNLLTATFILCFLRPLLHFRQIYLLVIHNPHGICIY